MAEAPAVVAPVVAPVTAPVVTSPVVAPVVTTPVVAPVTLPVTAPAVTDWLTGADADTVGLAGLKGWKSPLDAVKAYQHAQQFIGGDPNSIVKLPAADADKATKDAFYTKLGRPLEAKAYDIPVPTGAKTDYAEWAKGVFFEAGLTAEQGKALALKNNEYVATATKAAADARAIEFKTQNESLSREWGAADAQNRALVDKAIVAFGLDGATLAQLRDTMGPLKAMKLFHDIGKRLGEDLFVTPETRSTGFGNVLAPAEANARIKELRSDKDWSKAYLNGDAAKKAEMTQLQKWANPDVVHG